MCSWNVRDAEIISQVSFSSYLHHYRWTPSAEGRATKFISLVVIILVRETNLFIFGSLRVWLFKKKCVILMHAHPGFLFIWRYYIFIQIVDTIWLLSYPLATSIITYSLSKSIEQLNMTHSVREAKQVMASIVKILLHVMRSPSHFPHCDDFA